MTTETFAPFDSADYLNTFEDVTAYLEAVLEDSAREAGMSREGLYKALSADGNPTLATVLKVAHALGLRLHFEAIA